MSDNPKRTWLQFHLSTAVVLMLVGGGLSFLNTITFSSGSRNVLGWPCSYWEQWRISTDAPPPFPSEENVRHFSSNWIVSGIVMDVFLNVLILALVAYACEWRIRQRERQKAEQQ